MAEITETTKIPFEKLTGETENPDEKSDEEFDVETDEEKKYHKSFTCVCGSIGCTVLVLLIVASIYFSVIGVGYGMSYAIFKNTHNMTNGECYIKDRYTCQSMLCYFNSNQLSGFFGGCIPAGLICVLVLIFGPIIIILVVLLIACIIAMIGMIFWGIGIALYYASKHIYYSGVYIVRSIMPNKSSTCYGTIVSTNCDTDTPSDIVTFTSISANDSNSNEVEIQNFEVDESMVFRVNSSESDFDETNNAQFKGDLVIKLDER